MQLLALDIDGTLLSPDDTLQGMLLDTVCRLLRTSVKLAVLSDNDYARSIKKRVIEPISQELRLHLVVYADGCTRKVVYDIEGMEHIDADYYSISRFDPDDKPIIKTALLAEVDRLAELFPVAFQPRLSIDEDEEGKYHLRLGPLNTNDVGLMACRDRFQRLLVRKLSHRFSRVEMLPSDPMWVEVVCSQKNGRLSEGRPDEVIESTLRKLLTASQFLYLSKPGIVDRGEQLCLKPIKSAPLVSSSPNQTIRDCLMTSLEPKLTGSGRQTHEEYQVLAAGRTTVNVQRRGIDKSSAMRNFIETHGSTGSEVLYFGDAFDEGEGDRLVAGVEGVQPISVGDVATAPEGVIGVGGGPPVVFACLQSILWALTSMSDI